MSAIVIEQVTGKPVGNGRLRPRELRPGWGTGRRTRPQARPARPVAAPRLAPAAPRASSCVVERPVVAASAVPAPSSWRLTERGIALVLLTGLVIAAAALTVVTATALRVTGETYVPAGQVTTWQR